MCLATLKSSIENIFTKFKWAQTLRGYIHVNHHIFQGLEWAHIWLFFKPGFRASNYTFSIVHKTNLETIDEAGLLIVVWKKKQKSKTRDFLYEKTQKYFYLFFKSIFQKSGFVMHTGMV